jgi:hypothetical protein
MSSLSEAARAVVDSSALAHLVTLNPDVKFPPMDNPPPGYITHIIVDRVAGVGPWAAGG